MKIIKSLSLVLILAFFIPAIADDTTAPTDTITDSAPTTVETNVRSWNELLQKKYNLTDEQMVLLTGSKLSEPQMAMASQLAKTSNKSLEEILKMQSEKKTGWGALAKELGVNPKELGQAVSELNKERNEERKKALQEKREKKKERRDKKEFNDKKQRPEKKERAEHPGRKNK